MENFRQQVKSWLKESGFKRDFVAKKVGVTKATFNGWMSNYPIPPLKQRVLREMMNQYYSPEDNMEVDLSISRENVEMLHKLAASAGVSPDEYLRQMIHEIQDSKNRFKKF